jgi:hypothetical protein
MKPLIMSYLSIAGMLAFTTFPVLVPAIITADLRDPGGSRAGPGGRRRHRLIPPRGKPTENVSDTAKSSSHHITDDA